MIDLKQFLEMIAGPDGTIHIRTKAGKDIEEFWLQPSLYSNESLTSQFQTKSAEEHRNMWFQVGTVKANSKSAITANVIWADVDVYKYPGGELQVMGLLRRLPKPTVIVRSGRGLHIYWKLNYPVDASGPMSPAQILAKSAQWFLGADACHAVNKLLRIPYTYNFKPDEYEGGLLCEIIQHNDVSYDPKDFPVDEILIKIGHKLMTNVMLGPTEPGVDRSEYDFSVVAQLLAQGFSEEECEYLLRTYPFSGKVADEPSNAVNYSKRTVKSALFRVKVSGMNTAKPQKEAVAWVGKSLTEILKDEKPTFIVDDFLPNGGVAMIAAPPKARKSWSVMQLAYAVGTGQEWLGFKVSTPRKVLYIQAELPNWMVASRISQMYDAHALENVTFFHVNGANLMEDVDLDGLLQVIKEYQAELVIIDPLANFWQGDENSSSSVNGFFNQIAKIQALNCAVVLVHHSRKTEVNERLSPQHQRGSNVFFARPDAVMTLSPMVIPGQVPFTMADFALRAAEPKDALTLYTDSTGQFTITPPSLGATGSPVKQMLMRRLEERQNAQKDGVITFN